MNAFARLALWFVLGVMLAGGSARAQADTGTAEALMHKSGLWEQLGSLAPGVRAGFLQSMAASQEQPSASELTRLLRAIDQAYGADRLRAIGLEAIAQGLDARHVPALNRWYATPTGAKVSRLEEQAAAETRDPQDILREGADLLVGLAPRRRAALDDILGVTGSAELMAQLSIDMALAARRGTVSVLPESPGPSAAELTAALESQRPQLQQAYAALLMAGFVKTYAPLTDDELSDYVGFLKSDAGQHFNDLGVRALEAALVDAAAAFGRSLPGTRDRSNA